MIEREETNFAPEVVQVKLGESFSVVAKLTKESSYIGLVYLGVANADFKTNSGFNGSVVFAKYKYGWPGGLPTLAGPVEIKTTMTSDANGYITKELSFPLMPVVQLKIDSQDLGIVTERPLGDFDSNEREMTEVRKIVDDQLECFMIFGNKKYRGLFCPGNRGVCCYPETEWDREKKERSVFASLKFNTWIDPDNKQQGLWPLFPRDPNMLNQIQFVINHKPGLANEKTLLVTHIW